MVCGGFIDASNAFLQSPPTEFRLPGVETATINPSTIFWRGGSSVTGPSPVVEVTAKFLTPQVFSEGGLRSSTCLSGVTLFAGAGSLKLSKIPGRSDPRGGF